MGLRIPLSTLQPIQPKVVFIGFPYYCIVRGIATYLILALYIAFGIGLRVDINYCGTEVSSVDLLVWQGDSCCSPDKPHDCCSTESLFFKTTHEQSAGASLTIQPVADLFVGWAPVKDEVFAERLVSQEVIEAPPEKEGPPIYLRNSRLILYG